MRKNEFLHGVMWVLFAGTALFLVAACHPTGEYDQLPTLLECPSEGLPSCTRPVLPEDILADCAGKTARSLSAYEKLAPKMSFEEVCRQVGLPDWETGSGLTILIYPLKDGSEVWLGFPGLSGELLYALHIEQDGTQTTLFSGD